MIFREAALVIPLCVYVLAVMLGADPSDPGVFIPYGICQIAGMILYMAEVRYRFRHRGGRR